MGKTSFYISSTLQGIKDGHWSVPKRKISFYFLRLRNIPGTPTTISYMLVYASYHVSIYHHPKGSHHCFSNGSLPIHFIVLPLFKYQKNHNCPKKKAVGHQQLSIFFPVISHFRRKKNNTSAKNKRFPEVPFCVGGNFPLWKGFGPSRFFFPTENIGLGRLAQCCADLPSPPSRSRIPWPANACSRWRWMNSPGRSDLGGCGDTPSWQ